MQKTDCKYKYKILLICFVVIFCISFFSRFNLLYNSFVLDDFILVVNNTFITVIDNLFEVLNPKNYLFSVLPIRCGARPFTVASLIINYYVSNLNPFGYHFVNLFLHALNSCLIFLFCYYLKKRNLFFALTSCLFYSVHPIQTEVVGVISFRADLLLSFFSLIVLNLLNFFTVKNIKINKTVIYLFIFVFMCCAFFSKENAIVLPLIFFIFVFLFCNNTRLLKFSFLSFVFIIFLFFFFWVERFPVPLYFSIYPNLPSNLTPLSDFTSYINTIFTALFYNVVNILYPVNLSVDYSLSFSKYVTGLMIFFVLFLIFFTAYTKDKYLKFSLISLILMYLPVSNIVPLVNTVADRYLYFPMIAISVLFGLLMLKLQKYINKNLLICFLSVLFITNMFISYQRAVTYKNQYYMYYDAMLKTPDNIRVLYNMSVAYFDNKEYEKAIETLNKLISINPVYMRDKVWFIMGMSYDNLNNRQQAIRCYHKAFLLNPENKEISDKFICSFDSVHQAFQYMIKHTKKINNTIILTFQTYQDNINPRQ